MSATGPIGLSIGRADDATAKSSALDNCQKRPDTLSQPPKCELYAVGNAVVYAQGHPPMPPPPWVTRDPSIERPLVVNDIPLMSDVSKTNVEKNYVPATRTQSARAWPIRWLLFPVRSGKCRRGRAPRPGAVRQKCRHFMSGRRHGQRFRGARTDDAESGRLFPACGGPTTSHQNCVTI